MEDKNPDITTTDPVSPTTLRKRAERERKRAAGMKEKKVTLSPWYQQITDEIMDYTEHRDFNALVLDLLKAYHTKVEAHKARHQCCGKCGDTYKKGGSCVFEGDYQCQYSHGGKRNKELKP